MIGVNIRKLEIYEISNMLFALVLAFPYVLTDYSINLFSKQRKCVHRLKYYKSSIKNMKNRFWTNFQASFDECSALTSEQLLTALIISVQHCSTRLEGARKSCSICSLTILSNARSGVKSPERTPRIFWMTILISFRRCFSSIFRSAKRPFIGNREININQYEAEVARGRGGLFSLRR